MSLDLERIGLDRRPLALEILADGGAELWIGDVMRRPGDRGLEAAAHLVLTLSAGLEALDAPLDAELDALVIAGLEVQAVVVGMARAASLKNARVR